MRLRIEHLLTLKFFFRDTFISSVNDDEGKSLEKEQQPSRHLSKIRNRKFKLPWRRRRRESEKLWETTHGDVMLLLPEKINVIVVRNHLNINGHYHFISKQFMRATKYNLVNSVRNHFLMLVI